MDDFISLGQDKQKTEEFDVLKLKADTKTPPEKEKAIVKPVEVSRNTSPAEKPFYPRCKRILTRAPFANISAAASTKHHNVKSAPKRSSKPEQNPGESKPAASTNGQNTTPPKSTSSVAQISLQELMSVDEKEEEPPEKKRSSVAETGERLIRLRNMLKQAETEKVTLQGYVADLQAKLAAVPKKPPSRCTETQTDENGE